MVVVGLGRVGLECAKLALPHFDDVVGTVRRRDNDSITETTNDGIRRVRIQDVLSYLSDSSHVLITVPLSREADSVLERVWQRIEDSKPMWLGIVSTTGVYGNHDGAWVTEESPLLCTPDSNADLYRQFEEKWIAKHSNPCIFRCAGIYDSTRSALHTVYKQGYHPPPPSSSSSSSSSSASASSTPASNGGGSITNRIHTFDIARAIVASITSVVPRTEEPHIYNLADNLPAPRSEVLAYAANLFQTSNVALLTTGKVSASSSSTTTSRDRRRQIDRKLVSNRRMLKELLRELEYPTYREGLESILNDPTTPWQGDLEGDQR